ncbi:hypothetical protein PMM76_07825 [Bifidobacterium pseudocatenulatum]|nr:hypothetical protein [Bifidobacterium pseudocatenulatum]MDB6512053.1 hypothetical protein [Bifidobacterium pseudocatenulatum]MDB6515629.1 hypothetical protein [Bifidobacterium pseudocatenulatum]
MALLLSFFADCTGSGTIPGCCGCMGAGMASGCAGSGTGLNCAGYVGCAGSGTGLVETLTDAPQEAQNRAPSIS